MSRYVLTHDVRNEFVVGWDPPMGTFFAQEYVPEPADDEEECVWWVGYQMREIPTLDILLAVLKERGVEVPPDLQHKLAADAGASWEPGPLQKQLGYTGKEET